MITLRLWGVIDKLNKIIVEILEKYKKRIT